MAIRIGIANHNKVQHIHKKITHFHEKLLCINRHTALSTCMPKKTKNRYKANYHVPSPIYFFHFFVFPKTTISLVEFHRSLTSLLLSFLRCTFPSSFLSSSLISPLPSLCSLFPPSFLYSQISIFSLIYFFQSFRPFFFSLLLLPSVSSSFPSFYACSLLHSFVCSFLPTPISLSFSSLFLPPLPLLPNPSLAVN